MSKKIAILGIGNDFRGDDSIGLLAVRKAKVFFSTEDTAHRKLSPADAHHEDPSKIIMSTIESQGEISQIMDCFEKNDIVYIIDAVNAHSLSQGEVVRIDLNDNSQSFKMEDLSAATSTHSFSLKQIIDLAQALNSLPGKLVIYGIAGDNFSTTDQINPKLSAGIDQVLTMLKNEIEGLS